MTEIKVVNKSRIGGRPVAPPEGTVRAAVYRSTPLGNPSKWMATAKPKETGYATLTNNGCHLNCYKMGQNWPSSSSCLQLLEILKFKHWN